VRRGRRRKEPSGASRSRRARYPEQPIISNM
jgi:hypothetical protein